MNPFSLQNYFKLMLLLSHSGNTATPSSKSKDTTEVALFETFCHSQRLHQLEHAIKKGLDMTSRGLPGFLRRSLRRDDLYSTSEDEDDTENSIEDDLNGQSGSIVHKTQGENNQLKNTMKLHSSSLLDPSPLAETSAREDLSSGWRNISNTYDNTESTNCKSTASGTKEDIDEQISVSTLGEPDSGRDASHSHRDVTGSTLRFSSSTTNFGVENIGNNQNRGSKRHSTSKSYREIQFEKVLGTKDNNTNHVVKMSELRKIAWNGVPPQYRGMCWKILLGYLPTNAMRRQQTLERKRAEYKDAIRQHYYIDDNSRTIQEQETLRQVLVDVPRTAPDIPLFRNEKIKRALSRLLYIWAMRHPASSYVQGINDLATPLFAVFLADDYEGEDVLDGSVMVVLEEERLDEV